MLKTIVVTAGPTNERIDAVMKITNMATGSLGAEIVNTLLGDPAYAAQVGRIYYVSSALSRRPVVPDGQAYKLREIQVESTQDLLNTMGVLLRNPTEHIDAVVHSAAVGDYKGRYVARAEDLAQEIAEQVADAMRDPDPMDENKIHNIVSTVLTNPACVQNDDTKISSYEPNLMVMLDLTPKVIECVKKTSPDTVLVGFKLLENVPEQELVDVATRLLNKNHADYIVANDLATMTDGKHPAIIVGPNGVEARCETKHEIAVAVATRILPDATPAERA